MSNLSGQFDLVDSTEGLVLPGNTDVASFTDTNTNDIAPNFSATIDWGDGVTTVGTVVGANGSFTVEGGHTYADEGFPTGTVTITENTNNAQLVVSGGVFVADADVLNVNPPPNIVSSSQTLTNVVVATFTDNFPNAASDFNPVIDWGDNTTSTGTVTLNGSVYTVTGSHTYATNGSFTISTQVNDDAPDAASNGTQVQAIISFGGNLALNPTTEKVPFPVGTTVATFSDSVSDPASDYTATIDWGDGTTEIGSVTGSPGSFTVTTTVGHTYGDEGDFNPVVTITRAADGGNPAGTATITGTEVVSEGDNPSLSATTVTGTPGTTLTNVTVATFGGGTDSDFAATIDWGDGTVTAGTVAGGSVTGTHAYAQNGQFAIVVDVHDDPNAEASAFADTQSTAFIGLAPVAGSSLTIAEGNSVAAGTQVATFTDNQLSDTAGSFTATINWGDGTTDTGSVTGSNGSFTVTSTVGHTYTGSFGEEGQDTVTTTLTRTADSTTATALGAVNITESDQFALTADNISGNAGQALTNVQVATFTDTYTGHANGSDFTALISWGDGTTTLGTILGSGGSFTVDGSHTYTTGGNQTLTVSVADNVPGTATATGTATASINLAGQMQFTSATEGTAVPNTTPIATFSDSTLTDTQSSFTATIDWGDGVTTSGNVVGAAGSLTVEGGHTYADEGSDVATVTLTRTSDGSSATVSGPVAVAEGDVLAGSGTSITANAFHLFTGTVATFSDTDTVTPASDFTATIAWGDGTTSTGTVSGGSGSFTVSGSHAYQAAGSDNIQVTLVDDQPGTATATATSSATVESLQGQMVLTSATEGTALANTTAVATFTDANGSDTASSFTASINWGDGVTTAGTVVGSNGSFTVEGGHTYADEGSDPASVTLTRTTDQVSATASGTVGVAEGDALTGHSAPIMTTQNQPFSGTVATFTDTDTANVAGDFAATIAWGDGTTTAGTVSGSNGTFSVSGSHTYAAAGVDTVKVTLADDAPGTATATATSTADVGFPGQVVLHTATEGKMLPNNTPVATFTDSNPADHANSFTATIAWGDGVTTAGTVVGSGGTFTVEGGHRYLDEGNDNATVTLTRTSDHLQSTASGTVAVAEGDVLSPSGRIGLALPTFSGTIATFDDDGDPFNVPGDFTATIDWGDGTTTGGTVTGSGDDFAVNGSHTYATTGIDVVKVTLTDDAPGTATATATSLVLAVAPGHHSLASDASSAVTLGATSNVAAAGTTDSLSQIESFSGASVAPSTGSTMPDGSIVKATGNFDQGNNADLVSQASDGTPEIWLMNGTSVTGTVTLSNPGPSWQVVATGDFNGDGNPDILWQNTDGTLGIWEMNGTSVVSMTGLSNPGPTWHVVGAGDFNGDGNADILFQNSDGTPMIWEMNGTSVIAQATLTNPGSDWHAVATGDFFDDGHADILWQNDDGTPGIWQMNGTSIVSESALSNPGTSWQVIGTGDFTGDGKAGILWRSSDGTIGVWTMDGMTPTAMTAVPTPTPPSAANAVQASGSQPTMHTSSPDAAGAAVTQSAANPLSLLGGSLQQNLLQQHASGAGLHLT